MRTKAAILIGILFVLLVLFVVAFLLIRERLATQKELAAELDRWAHVGGKTDPGALAPAACPASENAAPLYEEAFALLEGIPKEDWAKLEDLSDTRALVHVAGRYRGVYKLLRAASKMPACVWSTSDNAGPPRYRQLGPAVRCGTFTAAIALAGAEREDPEEAVEAIGVGLRLGHNLFATPFPRDLRARLKIETTMLGAFERCFRSRRLPGSSARLFSVVLDHRDMLRQAVIAHTAWVFSRLRRDEFLNSLDVPGYYPDGLTKHARDIVLIELLRSARWFVGMIQQPYHLVRQERYEPMHSSDFVVTFLDVFLWELQSLLDEATAVQARWALARSAVELRGYWMQHREYPSTLANREDPFDGRPLQYRRLGEGFEMRSLGSKGAITWQWGLPRDE